MVAKGEINRMGSNFTVDESASFVFYSSSWEQAGKITIKAAHN